MKYNKILLVYNTLFILGLMLALDLAFAEWQIDISPFQRDLCSTASYDPRLCNSPSKIGIFATKEECEKARYVMCFGGGRNEVFLYNRSYCVGFDSPEHKYQPRSETSDIDWTRDYVMNELPKILENYRKQLELKNLSDRENFKRESYLLSKKLESKLSEKTKADYINSIKQFGYVAYFSLKALESALAGDLETARVLARCQFDYLDNPKCPNVSQVSIKVYIPPEPSPVLDNPQAKIYRYINQRANELLNRAIEIQQNKKQIQEKLSNIEEKLSNIKEKKENIEKELNKRTSQRSKEELLKEKQILENEENSLRLQAEMVREDAKKQNESSKKLAEEVKELKEIYNKASNNPDKADSLYKKYIEGGSF